LENNYTKFQPGRPLAEKNKCLKKHRSEADDNIGSKLPTKKVKVVSQLKQIQSNKDLAQFLGIKSVKMLTWLGKTKSSHYSKLFLRKKGKNSRLRVLHNPDRLMRIAQYRIYSKILNWVDVPDIYTHLNATSPFLVMAGKHVNKAIVISLDIKDFFHTIKQNQLLSYVYQLWHRRKTCPNFIRALHLQSFCSARSNNKSES
jgi:hypothetical protein